MNKIISVLLLCLMLIFSGCTTEEPVSEEENGSLQSIGSEVPSDFENENSESSEEIPAEDYDAMIG